jgi:hypothetical protein
VYATNAACISKVGYFDEGFYPAYFEDNDYHRRINLIDPDRYVGHLEALEPEVKRNSETIRRDPSLNQFPKSYDYYLRKWGGLPGSETYGTPFNQNGASDSPSRNDR